MSGPAGVSVLTGAQLRDSKKRSGPALLTERDSGNWRAKQRV